MFPVHQKYFADPINQRKSKASEGFSSSATEHAPQVVSSGKKKSLTHVFASTGAMIGSGVTFREHQRPITRSK
jgi:deoxyhypusine synthase